MFKLRLRDVKGLAKDNNTASKCTVLRVKLSLDWFQCQVQQAGGLADTVLSRFYICEFFGSIFPFLSLFYKLAIITQNKGMSSPFYSTIYDTLIQMMSDMSLPMDTFLENTQICS